MNAMGHDVPTMIGVDQSDVVKQITSLVPDYMRMGENGMADMGEMVMPLPDNTLPMMTGWGQFGPVEMGGMFTTLKVREDLAKGDYKDPGNYKYPKGTVAYELQMEAPAAERQPQSNVSDSDIELTVRKPTGHSGH